MTELDREFEKRVLAARDDLDEDGFEEMMTQHRSEQSSLVQKTAATRREHDSRLQARLEEKKHKKEVWLSATSKGMSHGNRGLLR